MLPYRNGEQTLKPRKVAGFYTTAAKMHICGVEV
jgi:hypothetical protein